MSKYSREHHIQLPQKEICGLMETFFIIEGFDGTIIKGLSDNNEDQKNLINDNEDLKAARYIISPTDTDGWSIIWSEWDFIDVQLLEFIAKEKNCITIYGHNNDQVDNWRWIIIKNGKIDKELWYLGQTEYDLFKLGGKMPNGFLTLKDAFISFGRSYHHFTFSEVLSSSEKCLGFPIGDFMLASTISETFRPI